MESSTVLAFRIFVMLACLIVVPMAAIFGSAFPDVVKSVLVDRIVAWGTGKAPDANASGGGFAEVTPASPGNPPGSASGNSAATANWEAPRWGMQAAPGVVPAGTAGAAASGGNQSASFSAPADPGHGAPGGYPPQRPSGAIPSAPQQPFSYPTGPPAMPGHDGAASAANHATPRTLEQPDRFTVMERKLREYGATYYLLETWGNEGELYRFHCKMAVGNNPNYTRHFEATDRDALSAIGQVLQRVESWRAGKPQ
jgi:hypothetical protein